MRQQGLSHARSCLAK